MGLESTTRIRGLLQAVVAAEQVPACAYYYYLLGLKMEETAIQLNSMSAEIESMVFRMILMKGITALVLLAIIVYIIYKLIKYYENKDIEITFSYKEKNKIDERKEPKL